jgi:hypothetical protein
MGEVYIATIGSQEHNGVNPTSCWELTVTGSDYFPFSKPYRCPVCGGEGVRSRRLTWMERHILPLFLMQLVRCAACYQRNYCSIFTPVRERSRHRDRNAA